MLYKILKNYKLQINGKPKIKFDWLLENEKIVTDEEWL